MIPIAAIHSFRRGTGKSNLTAGLAACLALSGRRVGVVDAHLQAPGMQILLGLADKRIDYSLNDYLWGECELHEAAYDLSGRLGLPEGGRRDGRLFLIPASPETGDIVRMLGRPIDFDRLNRGVQGLPEELGLEAVLIDTPAGLNEDTLSTLAAANSLVLVTRPEQHDYQGTAVIVEVARHLHTPRLFLVLNGAAPELDAEYARQRLLETYGCQGAAVLPHCDELAALGSSRPFPPAYPDHPLTARIKRLAEELLMINDIY
jgi:MinD-like ATPase involved in chromosome partitioning or flagellar assembly